MSMDPATHGALDARYHDAIADEYDRVVVQPRAWMNDRLFAPLLRGLSGRSALDLGCGTGHMTLRLARCFDQVIGVDHSAGMLQVAARNLRTAGHANVRFVQGSALQQLEAMQPGFDAISAVGFLHHLQPADMARVFARARALLAAQGRMLVAEPFELAGAEPHELADWNAHMRAGIGDYAAHAEDPDEHPLDPRAFQAMLEETGWRIAREARSWEILGPPSPRWRERLRMWRMARRHAGEGNVRALLLAPA